LDISCASASLNGLVLVSVERMYATLAPFKHRGLTPRVYFIALATPWGVSTAAVAFYLISRFYFFFASTVLTFLSLFLICVFSVVTLSAVSHQKRPVSFNAPRSYQQRERDLAKTLLIVTILSVITWLPNAVWTAGSGNNTTLAKIAFSGRFANSFVNPVVYFMRMKEFRKALVHVLTTCARST
ncbi:predicted protein, partial [Nematostella vectensis]